MKLADIAIRVEAPRPDELLGGGVVALLHEIAEMLDQLDAQGTAQAIDVRSLPLSPVEHQRLRELLGSGEVEATIDAEGRSQVRETAIPGVWWIEHRNAAGDVVAELIDVCRIPEILMVAADEPRRGARVLRERLAEGLPPAQNPEAT